MERITSRNNAKIKYACSLKKAARESAFVLAEGLRLCEDAAQNGVEIDTCFLTEALAKDVRGAHIAAAAAQSYLIDTPVCEKLTDTKNPQGIFCVCKKPHFDAQVDVHGKYLFLENIRDPGNFGTMLRTAEAFGLSGVITYGCCDAFSSKAMRASMGAVFRFPIIEAGTLDYLDTLTAAGMQLFCAVVAGQAEDVRVLAGKSGVITAVGNEANGLSEALIARGTRITIPMAGRAESFNASQAATVMMYEMSK